jgi:hypothetical protein
MKPALLSRRTAAAEPPNPHFSTRTFHDALVLWQD